MGIILGDSGTLQSISYGGGMIGEWGESKLLKSFTYTGSDQVYTIPEDGKYTFKVKGAGSNNAKGGYAEGTFTLNKGDKISVMVGQNGGSQSTATYGFGGSGNYGSDRAGGGLSGVFTGEGTITASDSARAMIIAGGAGAGNSKGNGGMGGGEEGQAGQGGSYGTAGSGGTQTRHGSAGNKGANQFNGGNGSGTYGQGGGGGWRGGNSSIGDSSGDDDRNGGGGSGYVLSTAEGKILTQGAGADAKSNGSIEMYQSVKVYKGNVKKVMLGEVQVWPEGVEPSSYDYSYDLLGKSVAQMKTDGWKFSREDYWENTTNGLHCTTSNDTAKFRTIGRDVNLTDATKIVMEADVYSVQGSWNGFCGIQVFGQLGSQPVSTGGGWFCENNSSYNGYRVMSVGREVYNRTNVATGNYHIITTVDLVSKKISFTIGSYTTVETTMTDAEINATKGYTLFGLYYDNVGCYVKNCSIHVEY